MKPSSRTLLLSSLTVAAGCAAVESSAATKEKAKRPNIVLIISDDVRMLDLGCYGSPDSKTPNINRLASEGLKFNNFFQAVAMSSPTRHCMLTGIYPVRSGAYPNHTFINDGIHTLPYYLKNEGYRVAIQGKRHFNPESAFPFEYLSPSGANVDISLMEPFVADVAKTGEPFFLYVASHDAHSPWTRGDRTLFDADKLTLPPTLADTKETREAYRNYLAEINLLDSDVGRVDALIKKYNLDKNTIFIFTSEQGHSFPFAKWTCYDAGVRTGFIVRWPGVVKPGSTTDAYCEYVDITPTLTDIAKAKTDKLDGRSFLPVLQGKAKEHKSEVYSLHTTRGIINGSEYFGIRMVRDHKFSYILNLTPEAKFQNAATNPKDKIWASWLEKAKSDGFAASRVNAYATRPAEELYDMKKDPFQMNNLAADPAYAKEKARLRKLLDAWMARQGDKGQQTELEAKAHQWAGKDEE